MYYFSCKCIELTATHTHTHTEYCQTYTQTHHCDHHHHHLQHTATASPSSFILTPSGCGRVQWRPDHAACVIQTNEEAKGSVGGRGEVDGGLPAPLPHTSHWFTARQNDQSWSERRRGRCEVRVSKGEWQVRWRNASLAAGDGEEEDTSERRIMVRE